MAPSSRPVLNCLEAVQASGAIEAEGKAAGNVAANRIFSRILASMPPGGNAPLQKARLSLQIPSASISALLQDNSPFALARTTVAGREQIVFRHGATCLSDIYRKASQSGRPFLITDEATCSGHDLFGTVGGYARLLAKRNIGPGCRVALALTNDADWIAAFVALTSLGATAVLTGDADAEGQAAAAGCRVAITDQAPRAAWEDIVWADELHATEPESIPDGFRPIDSEQEACIAFTSGSSSAPKGVILTHRGMTTGLMNMMLAGAMASRSANRARARMAPAAPVTLLRTPLHHVSGYMQMLLMFLVGGRIVRSAQTAICPLIALHQVTSIIGASDEDMAMLLDAGAEGAKWSLRAVAIAGRNLPASLRRAVRTGLPDLSLGTGYGLTETNGLVSTVGTSELDLRPDTVGPVLPTVECRITREDGQECARGEAGEINLRGAMMMRGYAQGEALADGWFKTGDSGWLSDDGYLHVLDRDERVLRDGDWRISCREIEEAARTATGLREVAAISVREDGRERLLIAVSAGPDELVRLRAALARQFPVPIIEGAKLIAVERLPRTTSGKIAYGRLADEWKR